MPPTSNLSRIPKKYHSPCFIFYKRRDRYPMEYFRNAVAEWTCRSAQEPHRGASTTEHTIDGQRKRSEPFDPPPCACLRVPAIRCENGGAAPRPAQVQQMALFRWVVNGGFTSESPMPLCIHAYI